MMQPDRRRFTALLLAASGGGALAGRASARDADFEAWLASFRAEARGRGISDAVLARAFAATTPIERVIELDRRQPEGRMSFAEYRQRVISDARIAGGATRLKRHQALLDEIAARYGVAPEVLMSLWGIESSFGEFKGRFSVIDSLATLAWDGRRAEFFTNELLSALEIVQNGDIDVDGMFGSWAGAMGQCQFMPSTYLGYAVDHDGDGRRDIWTSLPDTFASMSNYLSRSGWQSGYIWGREARLPAGFDPALEGLETSRGLAEWQRLGVRRANGADLPAVDIDASVVAPDGLGGSSFLVYQNFRTLRIWNRSTYFALSVGLLADSIAAEAAA